MIEKICDEIGITSNELIIKSLQEENQKLRQQLYELGGVDDLCYDTPLTDDVIGNLTNDEVLELLEKIKNL